MTRPRSKFKKVKWLFGKEIEIPKEWNLEKLEKNSTLKGRIGWQGLTTIEYLETGNYYLVTGTDFKNGKIGWERCVYVDEIRYAQDQNIQLKNEDVLVTKDGTIGKIAYVSAMTKPATLNSGIFVIRPVDKKYSPLFLFYILYSFYFLKFLNSLQAGSTINHLYQKDFVNFQFPLPSISEQQKIALILSGLDATIEATQKVIEKTEMLKKGLMQMLLTLGIGHTEFKKVKSLYGRYKEIPEEWEHAFLSDIVIITMGQSPPSSTYNENKIGLPFFQGMTEFGYMYPEQRFWCSEPKKIAEKDQILFSVRASVGEINISNTKCCIGRGLAVVTPKNSKFTYSYYALLHFKNHFMQYSQGTTYDAIDKAGFKKIIIPYAKNKNEQQKIASILSRVDEYIQKNQQYKRNMERLKKGLMQKLLTGQIRVKVES